MVSGGFGLAIDSVKHFGIFNEDSVESVVLGIIVIVVLSWLTLTAYTLFREPKLLKHWNYTNLGLLGVIALFGISSFLVASLFIIFILQLHLPDLLPALVLSDESVYSDFFTYAFVTQAYMWTILFCRKRRNKHSDANIVPESVTKVIRFNLWALVMILSAGFLLFFVKESLKTGRWDLALMMVWLMTLLVFLGRCLRTAIEYITGSTKQTKRSIKFDLSTIKILWVLILLLSIPIAFFSDQTEWFLLGVSVLGIIFFMPGLLPQKLKAFFEGRFFNRTLKLALCLIVISAALLLQQAQDRINWVDFGTGIFLMVLTGLSWFRPKEIEGFIKRNKSRLPKGFQRQLKSLK